MTVRVNGVRRRRRGRVGVLVGALVAAHIVASSSCTGDGVAPGAVVRGADVAAAPPRELLVAYRTDDKPVSFLLHDKPAGLYVELIQHVAQRAGLRASFVATDFASALPSVRDHLYDTAAMSVLVTDDRKQDVNFTTAVYYNDAAVVSRNDAPLPTVEAAQGRTVAVTHGSALINLLKKNYSPITVKVFPNISASLAALESADVDGVFTGFVTAKQLARDHPTLLVSTPVVSAQVAFPVALDRPRLLAILNEALAATMLDGTYTRLREKWAPNEPVAPQLLHDYPGMPALSVGSPAPKK